MIEPARNVEDHKIRCGILWGMATPDDLQQIIARNVKTIRRRSGLTQAQLAQAARLHGLIWTRNTIAQIETGGKRVQLAEAIVLAATLEVPLAELAQPSGTEVAIETGVWSAGYLRAVIEGNMDYPAEFRSPEQTLVAKATTLALGSFVSQRQSLRQNLMDRWDLDPDISHAEMKRIAGWNDPTDVEVAAWIEGESRLGVTPGEVMIASKHLWGQSFQEERDARAVDRPGRPQQVKGRITRELRDELNRQIEQAADRASNKESK